METSPRLHADFRAKASTPFWRPSARGLEHGIETVRKGGRVAYPNGVEPVPKERPGIEIISYDGQSGVREFEALNEAIERGKVVVPIAAEFPLDQAARAHERLAAGQMLGKIVLRVQPD